MQTFAGNKPLATIKAQCKAQGVRYDDSKFKQGSDYVLIGVVGDGHVLYNTFNGKFFGRTHKGTSFDSSATTHEKVWWFKALLEFFYTNDLGVA